MQKYDSIEKGIVNNDVKALRESIGSICYTDRSFSNGEFFEVVNYVESKGIALKDQELIGEPIISSQKKDFADEDFTKAVFLLKKNFCDERIQDVITIGKALYGKDSYNESTQIKESVYEKKSETGIIPNQHRHQNSKRMIIVLVAMLTIIILTVLIVVFLHGRK